MASTETHSGRIPRWTTSQDGVLGLLASNDLLLRTLADIPWSRVPRLVDALSENVLVSLSLTLLAEYSGVFGTLAAAAQWLLLAYLFAIVTPYLFRRSARPTTTNRSFRLVVAIIALGFAFVITNYLYGRTLVDANGFVIRFTGVCLAGAFLFGAHFAYSEQWNDLQPNSRVELLNQFVPVPVGARQELVSGFTAGGWRARVERLAWKLAIVIVCLVPVFVLGLVAVFSTLLYPLLELLVLGGLAIRRWGGSRSRWLLARIDTDIEARLYRSVEHAGRGLKGMTLTVLLFIGLLFPVGLGTVVIAYTIQRLGDPGGLLAAVGGVDVTRSTVVLLWNQIGVVTTLGVSAGLQIWFWIRMLDRLPFYLDAWEQQGKRDPGYLQADAGHVEPLDEMFDPHYLITPPPFYQEILERILEGSGRAPPPRLIGAILITMLAVGASTGFVLLESRSLAGSYAVVWPALVTILVASVVLTAKRDSQPIRTDAIVFPGSLVVQLGGYLLLLSVATRVSTISSGFSITRLVIQSGTGVVLFLVPWLFFVGDVDRFGRRQAGLARYALPLYLAGPGVCGLFVSRVFTIELVASLISVISWVSLLGSLMVALGIRFERSL